MATCLGQLYGGCQPCQAGTKQHLSTGTQDRPPLEINATYGGSADLKNNNFFFWVTGRIQSLKGEGRQCAVWEVSVLWVCDQEPELTSEEVVCCDDW